MKNLLLCSVVAVLGLASVTSAEAKDKDKHHDNYRKHDNRYSNDHRDYSRGRGDYGRGDYGHSNYGRDRSRTIYVIERNRPVARTVYVTSDGRYYRRIEGRRVFVTSRHYNSYPSRYYYPDGRRRVNVNLSF